MLAWLSTWRCNLDSVTPASRKDEMHDKTTRADLNVGVTMRLLGQDHVSGGWFVCVACLEPGQVSVGPPFAFGESARRNKQAVRLVST